MFLNCVFVICTQTNFKGRVFMTHPTKAVYKWMLADFVKVRCASETMRRGNALHGASPGGRLVLVFRSTISTEDMLFDEKDLDNSMDKIETMNFHQTVEVRAAGCPTACQGPRNELSTH
jgi:cleavage and polyadenylation specificity factor subunit 3